MHSLTKGASTLLKKTSLITARCSWMSGTDYEVHALVLYRDGLVEHIATFDAVGVPKKLSTDNGSVRHLGDVGVARNGGTSEEILEIRLTPEIAAVVPVAYSAQGNGTGSFRQYQVSMTVDNGAGDRVHIPAHDASSNPLVYSCVPGIIINGSDDVQVAAASLYSGMGSENRPTVSFGSPQKRGLFSKVTGSVKEFEIGGIVVTMDAGPRNRYKAKKH